MERKRGMRAFFKSESATGVLLIIATVLAMIAANTGMNRYYTALLDIPVVVSFNTFVIAKPLLLWINDGLMAIFFFMVGMEIKRELLDGSLQERSRIVVPAMAALGGMVVPALIYMTFNHADALAMRGWAIPMATDIAFALGILSLLGNRVPPGLKLFLLALAIIDDLGAIIVIALFYGKGLSLFSLGVSGILIALLVVMNRMGVRNQALYIIIGIFMWVAVLKSGVHATIAGVILGLLIPYKGNAEAFKMLEHSLHAPVNYFILPLFAFVNTGVSFGNVTVNDFSHPVIMGIATGLMVGKSVGIFFFSMIAVKLGWGKLPEEVDKRALFGVAMLGGIGFTMSLFIGTLAFSCSSENCMNMADERIGILLGSFFSGLAGFIYLKKVIKADKKV